jgi:nucleotide-binding universal stress UspA family protein
LQKALYWARLLGGRLCLAAAYDPAFHTQVFRTMGRSLSAQRKAEVGLNKQEKLHDQIIDEGLGELYRVFLDQALQHCRRAGLEPEAKLLQGKAYQALLTQAQSCGAGLVVVGRFGHHRTGLVPVGSNAAAVAETAGNSVLMTALGPGLEPEAFDSDSEQPERAAAAGTAGTTEAETSAGARGTTGRQELSWEAEALRALERVPGFARPMARAAVEEAVRRKGAEAVTVEDFREVAARFGMGRSPADG